MTLTPEESREAQHDFTLQLEAIVREQGVTEVLYRLVTLCDVLAVETPDDGWGFAADAIYGAAERIAENDDGPFEFDTVEDSCND